MKNAKKDAYSYLSRKRNYHFLYSPTRQKGIDRQTVKILTLNMISLEIKLPTTYLAVKREELEFLAENSKTPFSFARAKKWTFSDLFQFYCELRENGQRLSRGYLGESGMPGVEIPMIGGFKFDYSYQRLRLNSANISPFVLIHPSSDIKFAVQSLFLISSAQAGLTQLFESIHQSWGRLPVWTPYSCDHETK